MNGIRRATRRAILIACSVVLVASGSTAYFWKSWARPAVAEPLFPELGSYHRAITTHSETAQKYFDQGLAFFYGFNADAAAASFEAAAASDPDCAMAYWGIAMSQGAPVDDPQAAAPRALAAYQATREALRLAGDASPVEQALIKAAAQRFDVSLEIDPAARDQSYASAMRRAWQAFPDDPDVGALTAKAISAAGSLDVCAVPGRALPPSPEVVRSLETVLARHPDHPYALHLLIHALEGTEQFERAKAAADYLRNYAPGLSHLVHMPSHIDIRRGDWDAAMTASQRAIASEKNFEKLAGDPGFFRVMALHNYHMLIYVAAMQGNSALATQAAKEVLTKIPADYRDREVERVDFYYALPYQLHIRFGRWKAMLAEPAPPNDLPIATAMWQLGKAMAYVATGDLGEAKFEQATLVSTVMTFYPDARSRKISGPLLFKVAGASLGGAGLSREGKVNEAIEQLRQAVHDEDELPYMEPPDLLVPARHVLGALLLTASRDKEAETVYREDLARHPHNGWSLFGLWQSLQKQKRSADAAKVEAEFNEAWKHADIKLTASYLGLPAKRVQ
jgi:tetratricopeptide (TPR) repeat protein